MEYLRQPEGDTMMIIPDIRPSRINPANVFTLARIPLLLVGFALYVNQSRILGVTVMALAALTDFFDGRVARRLHCETEFGRQLDPLTDKVFMAMVVIFGLTQVSSHNGLYVLWAIVANEAILALITIISLRKFHHVPIVVKIGKWGMLGRMTSVVALLLATALVGSAYSTLNVVGVVSGLFGVFCGVKASAAYIQQMRS